MSFDVLELIERLDVNADWAKLIVAHIYLDHILELYINDHFPRADVYLNSGHRGFAEKLSVCVAQGLIDEELSVSLRAVNACRNKFAHNLIFDISDTVKEDLFRSFTKDRSSNEVLTSGGFDNFLLTVVLMAEINRQATKKSATLRREIKAAQDELFGYVSALIDKERDRDGK
jgi:hypothetical protein